MSSSGVSVVGSTGGPVEAEVGDDGVEVGVGREGAEVAQGGELALDVVDGGADEQAEEGEAALLVEAAGDAEVEERDRSAPVGQHEQVPAVEVAVEDAVEHGALQEGDHPRPDQAGGVDAGLGCMPSTSSKAKPDEPLHHQHPPGDQLGVGPGHDVGPLAPARPATGPCRACCRPRGGSRAPR